MKFGEKCSFCGKNVVHTHFKLFINGYDVGSEPIFVCSDCEKKLTVEDLYKFEMNRIVKSKKGGILSDVFG